MADATKKFADSYAARTPHAVLLTGPNGIGLRALAEWLARRSGTIIDIVEPTKPTGSTVESIAVDRIRTLYDATRSGGTGLRFVVIDEAHKMNHTSQNALLKLLEEPSGPTRFILTTHMPELLLETVMSRVQWFAVPKIEPIESRRLLTSLGVLDERKLGQLLYVADGLPARLTTFARDEAAFKRMVEDVTTARGFIEGSRYDRLRIIQTCRENRQNALNLIDNVLLLLEKISSARPDEATYRLADRLIATRERVVANGNVRLQLAHAVIY